MKTSRKMQTPHLQNAAKTMQQRIIDINLGKKNS